MRKIFLDTETTGFSPAHGARVVEIAAVAEENAISTNYTASASGSDYHQYINPECPVPADAYQVHGLSDDFLAGMPIFTDIVASFLNYIKGSEVIIHNANFDCRLLNAELERLGKPPLDRIAGKITCSLQIARARNIKKQGNSLDTLCQRYNISPPRQRHSALTDARLLRAVYQRLTANIW